MTPLGKPNSYSFQCNSQHHHKPPNLQPLLIKPKPRSQLSTPTTTTIHPITVLTALAISLVPPPSALWTSKDYFNAANRSNPGPSTSIPQCTLGWKWNLENTPSQHDFRSFSRLTKSSRFRESKALYTFDLGSNLIRTQPGTKKRIKRT